MFRKPEIFIGLHYLRITRKGFISFLASFAIAGVFIGVATLIIVIGIMSGFHSELRKRILGLTPHILITRFYDQPVESLSSVEEKLKNVKEIANYAPYIYTKGMIKKDIYTDGVVIKGIPSDGGVKGKELEKMIVMGEFDLDTGKVLLGTDLAAKLRVLPGDTISLYSALNAVETPFGMTLISRKLIVAGIFDAGLYDYNTSFVLANLADVADLTGFEDAVSGIEADVKDPAKAPYVARELTGLLSYPFRVTTWIDMNRSLFSALKLEKLAMFIVLILIVIVASFGIVATLSMLVKEKTREIGVLRSMGVTKRGIQRIFLFVGMLIGNLGAILGAIFGIAAGELIERLHLINLPPGVYFIDRLPVLIQAEDVVTILLSAFLIVLIASFYPAKKAASLPPSQAIRYE